MSEFFPTPAPQTESNFPAVNSVTTDVIANVESSKAIAEVQASLVIAKRFPRDEQKAVERIKNACCRASLANSAIYSYSRGGSSITGASIRLLEAIKCAWGNIDSGWRELERNNDRAIVQAYAWDKETNTKEERTFEVPLIRYTRKGSYKLSDPRDIYELEANNASRRVRACLQALIPADVIEDAMQICIETQKANVDMNPEAIKKLLNAFEEIGVSKEMIESRLQRNIGALEAGHVIQLRSIYRSIVDGIGKVQDFFEEKEKPEAIPEKPAKAEKASSTEKQEEKTFKTLAGMIDKFKAGKLEGTTAENIAEMITNSGLASANQQALLDKLNSSEI